MYRYTLHDLFGMFWICLSNSPLHWYHYIYLPVKYITHMRSDTLGNVISPYLENILIPKS